MIREITLDDAENLIDLIKQVESESKYMLMEAGERQTTPEQQRNQLERLLQQHHSTIFVAEEEGKLVGYLMSIGGSVNRTKHTAYLVIGILEEYRGKGIGTRLFKRLDQWAARCHMTRLELTVVTENEPGIALYKKSGFEIEGIKRNSLKIDGEYYNEYFMAKLVESC